MKADGNLSGKTCPYCLTLFTPGEEVVYCSTCAMPHHTECWEENTRCTTFGCQGTPTDVPRTLTPAPLEITTENLPLEPAVSGMSVCQICGALLHEDDTVCLSCRSPRGARRGMIPPAPVTFPRATYPNPPHPALLNKWSWGAFMLPIFWSAAMGLWEWFAVAIALLIVCWPFGLILAIYLGVNGNALAWHRRRWDNYRHFTMTQEVWDRWGLVIFVIVIGLVIISIAINFTLQ